MSRNQPDHDNDCACEDCVGERDGIAYGLAHAGEFCGTHQVMIQRLIAAYSDQDAHDALDNLRELFWAQLWVPSPGQPIKGV